MQLTKEQIEDLYQFTRLHFVEWHDLQTELVDHLANDIEHILQENPQLSFKEARDKAFKKFGVFGFMEIIEQKQKQLNKRYLKILFKEFKTFFTIPKIAISIFLFLVFYIAFYQFKINRIWFFSLLLVESIFPLYYVFKYRKELNRKYQKTGKKYLFEEYITNLGGLVGGLGLPLQLFLNIKNIQHQTTAIWLSVFLVAYGLILYISIFKMPKKIKNILQKEYPKYAML